MRACTRRSMHAVDELVHHPQPVVLTIEGLYVVLYKVTHVRVLAEVLVVEEVGGEKKKRVVISEW